MKTYWKIKLENGYGRWGWSNAKIVEQATFMQTHLLIMALKGTFNCHTFLLLLY
jgi:hypothetical protein